MKRIVAILGIMSFVNTGVALAQKKKDDKKTDKKVWYVDPQHTKVGFEVSHLVISSVEGNFREIKGSFTYDEKNVAKTSIDAQVCTSSVDTGVEKRDKHLRSEDFFNAKKNPTISLKTKSIQGKDPKKFKMVVDMTINGITKPVTFNVKMKGKGKAYGTNVVSFKADASIKRETFKLTWNDVVEIGPVVGEEVDISIKMEGMDRKPKGYDAFKCK